MIVVYLPFKTSWFPQADSRNFGFFGFLNKENRKTFVNTYMQFIIWPAASSGPSPSLCVVVYLRQQRDCGLVRPTVACCSELLVPPCWSDTELIDTVDPCWTGSSDLRPELHHIIQCSNVVVLQRGGNDSVNKDPLSTLSDTCVVS